MSTVNNWLRLWYGIYLDDEENARWQFENVRGMTFADRALSTYQTPGLLGLLGARSISGDWVWWDPLHILPHGDKNAVTWSGFWARHPSAEEMLRYENDNKDRPEAFVAPVGAEAVSIIAESIENGTASLWDKLRPVIYAAFVFAVVWVSIKIYNFFK